MEKARELMGAVEVLRQRIGDEMVIVDHWDGDLTAVGIARSGAEERLAYLCIKIGSAGEKFYVALEDPRVPSDGMPYTDAGEHDGLSLADAVDIVARHLSGP